MLEKPDLPDEQLIACLRDAYGLHVSQIAFLPIGNDVNTAVYRVVADDATPYFLKLRSGAFDDVIVAIPHLLRAQGITQIIAPLATRAGTLWTRLDAFAVILSPFVAGRNGFAAPLSDRQWIELGGALRDIHTAVVPDALRQRIPHETFSPHWRDAVRAFQTQAEETAFDDPIAAQMAAFLRAKRDTITDLVERAERLGNALRARSLDYVVCHADLHGANVLIDANDTLYIVDWDTLVVAPKERDLMFIGAGIGGAWRDAREATLFYQGYGQTAIDPTALAYYRYERIIEDIAEYCARILLTEGDGADRAKGLRQFTGQFLPNRVIAIAYQSDTSRVE